MNITVPDAGWYWIEMEYTLQNCTDCCGKTKTFGTTVNGCDATLATNQIQQGKPKIWAATEFKDWNGYTSLGSFYWREYKLTCICDCQ